MLIEMVKMMKEERKRDLICKVSGGSSGSDCDWIVVSLILTVCVPSLSLSLSPGVSVWYYYQSIGFTEANGWMRIT